MVLVCFLVGSIQPYLWTYDTASGECIVRLDEVSRQPIGLWNVWSWSTEMLIFLVIPLIILAVNALVMREVWRISTTHPLIGVSGGGDSSVGFASPTDNLSVVSVPPASPFERSNHRVNQHHHQQQHQQQQQQQQQRVKHQNQRQHTNSSATNVMLLSVSFYVIFTTLPATLVYVLATAFPEGADDVQAALVTQSISAVSFGGDVVTAAAASVAPADSTWSRYVTFVTVRNIVNEMCLSHYACNFFLFVATGREFRAAVRRTFCCRANSSADSTQTEVLTDATVRQHVGVFGRERVGGALKHPRQGDGFQHNSRISSRPKQGTRLTTV